MTAMDSSVMKPKVTLSFLSLIFELGVNVPMMHNDVRRKVGTSNT